VGLCRSLVHVAEGCTAGVDPTRQVPYLTLVQVQLSTDNSVCCLQRRKVDVCEVFVPGKDAFHLRAAQLPTVIAPHPGSHGLKWVDVVSSQR